MSFLKKLFGKKEDSTSSEINPPSQRTSEEMREDPNFIRVFDKYGQELFITKDEWRKNVLPGGIKKSWDNPDELYGIIIQALNDGFRSDIIDAARHLFETDSNHERGACVWGIVLMEEDRLDEAEKVFKDFVEKHGESGVILTNLAKVFSKRNDDASVEKILWRALELDPNQDSGFGWYVAIHRERGGEAAGLRAMLRVAALPGSWRAQVWLARDALAKNELTRAITLYEESLSRVDASIPGDLLMQISGDLGNAGHLKELVQLIAPRFNVDLHGLEVGNNLIKAHLDLGDLDAARRILGQLYAKNRLDWRETLGFWDTELAKAGISDKTIPPNAQVEMGMLAVEGPVWLKPTSPAASLFSTPQSDIKNVFCFFAGTVESSPSERNIKAQLADTRGRLSRAIPLFFAEQVEFAACGRTQTLISWVNKPSPAFALCGVAWKDEDAVKFALQNNSACQYVVTTHFKKLAEPWQVDIRLIRVCDGNCVGHFSESISSQNTTVVLRLAKNLLNAIQKETNFKSQPIQYAYTLPGAANFSYYLLRLEQLLAVRCAGMEVVAPEFLSGAREVMEGNIQLCLQTPKSVNVRLLFAQTLQAMKRTKPEILPEFKKRINLLQTEHPLCGGAQEVVQKIIDEVYV